jgi:uncharacterized membrane protein YidH (DUF202 family)
MKMFRFMGVEVSESTTKIGRILEVFANLLDEFLLPFVIAIGVLGAVYGLYLGINYSRAEGDARKEAQKRIINFIIGLVAVIVLVVLLVIYTNNAQAFIDWIEIDILDRGSNAYRP